MDTEKTLSRSKKHKISSFFSRYGIIFAFTLICVVFIASTDRFLTTKNITNVLRQVAVNGVLANGMMFVILTGGIDLSVGSVLAVSGVIVASLIKGGYSITVSILAAMVVAVIFGVFNGYFVARRKMAAFIVTMASNTIARGLAYIITDAKPVSISDSPFNKLSSTYLLGLPSPVWILIFVFLISYFILYKTSFGRYIYAVGGNELTARISGINVDRIKIFAYMYCGLMCGLAALLSTARVTSGLCNAGDGFELDAIAAVVIGGTSLSGGKGRLWGAMIGVLIIGVINNGMGLLAVNSYWQQIVKGITILLAVLIDKLNGD